jgi:hypothetical protein
MIQEHFFYSTMIENDGHLRTELTFAGAMLVTLGLVVGITALIVLCSFL